MSSFFPGIIPSSGKKGSHPPAFPKTTVSYAVLIYKTFYDNLGTIFLYMTENNYFVNIIIKENIYLIYVCQSIEIKFCIYPFCPKNGNHAVTGALTKYFNLFIYIYQMDSID